MDFGTIKAASGAGMPSNVASKLEYQAILDIANRLHQNNDDMIRVLDEIDRLYKDTCSVIWTGTAAGVAMASFKEFVANFISFVEAIDSEERYLKTTVDRYQAADRQVQSQF